MQIVLITSSSNAVRETIESLPYVEVYTINCANFNHGSFVEIKNAIFTELEKCFSEKGIPDLLLTYRCPCLIPKSLYSQARIGAFNIHPSLLPKYPGLNPWEEIFHNKECESGITIHFLSEKPDSGSIVLQEKFQIETNDTIYMAREKSDHISSKMVRNLICLMSNSLMIE